MQICIGEIKINTDTGTIVSPVDAPTLTPLSLEFFLALIDVFPATLGERELAQKVWKKDHVSYETLTKRVSLLRTELNTLSPGLEFIRTLPNRHYGLAVEPIKEQVPSVAKPPFAFSAGRLPVLGVTLLVAVAGGVLWYHLAKEQPARLVDPETGLVLEAPKR